MHASRQKPNARSHLARARNKSRIFAGRSRMILVESKSRMNFIHTQKKKQKKILISRAMYSELKMVKRDLHETLNVLSGVLT